MIRRSMFAVIVLAVGVVAGVGIYQFRQVDAAPSLPVTIQDADVDADGQISILDLAGAARYYGQAVPNVARPVAEQNLDANGNIKVHEQGVVVATVKRMSRVIPVTTAFTVTSADNLNPDLISGWIDVRDCKYLYWSFDATLLGSFAGNTETVAVLMRASLDGTTTISTSIGMASHGWNPGSTPPRHSYLPSSFVGNAPYIQLAGYVDADGAPAPVEVGISLFCTSD